MNEAAWPTLRDSTRADHALVESLPRMRRLFADDFRVDEFRDLLTRMLALHAPLEAVLAVDPGAAVGYLPRVPLLQAGLAALGADPALARPAAVPELGNAASRWGALYVIEGSILGGQLIHRHICRLFPDLPPAAAAFYLPYGDAAGPQWQRVRSALDAALASPAQLDRAVTAARATFAAFVAVLSA
ncbi:biliverdin-producing heme oxygenase [Magnetospirillum sp. UT-4]|uniref:biliverdin-producing heme oxygenase n=1 Tax=Magnetospirillum sp. UT-4 TaxID=2681467 RepID=UPI0013857EC0|nr:biliverdin-producing heme oxygenase [Magnetospirillum sp. UT-4]CAA7625737.1 putative heme oxygenase [Magnetospirillum sp. UT-4]